MSDSEGYQALGEAEMEAAAKGKRNSWLQRWRMPLIVGGPVVIAAIAIGFWLTSGKTQSTDNAYIQVAKAPVAASIPGRVVQVYVKENQQVRAGQPLFRLDARDFQASAAQAAAQLAQTELDINARRASYQQQQAGVAAAEEALAFATREAARQRELVVAGVSSRQQAEEAAHSVDQARLQLAAARQQAAAALATLGGDPNRPLGAQPTVMAARAALQRAQLNQSFTEVVAATDGVVTRVEQLQPGAFINASQTVFWLLTGKPYVEANFKEDQLAKMRVGQPVEIKIDAFPDERLTGRVESFSPGTGAVFSALPAQNATGNWVKVTQRLPVRIAFDRPLPELVGRAGLSAHVKVDVTDPGAAAKAR